MGGTPLFNESTGEFIDRFTYLKKKFAQEKWAIDEIETSDEMR